MSDEMRLGSTATRIASEIRALDRALDAMDAARESSVVQGMRWEGAGQAAVLLAQEAADERRSTLVQNRRALVDELKRAVASGD